VILGFALAGGYEYLAGVRPNRYGSTATGGAYYWPIVTGYNINEPNNGYAGNCSDPITELGVIESSGHLQMRLLAQDSTTWSAWRPCGGRREGTNMVNMIQPTPTWETIPATGSTPARSVYRCIVGVQMRWV
jgi:hypothetical protein